MKTKLKNQIAYNFIQQPVENEVANVLVLHGYADHIGRYQKLISELNRNNCSVYGIDFRGHGKTSGKRAYVNSFDEYLRDIDWLYQQVPKKNLKIFAHSMGALVAVKWLLTRKDHEIQSVVLSSGLFKLDDSVAPFLRKLAKYLSFFAPWIKATKIDVSKISKIPEEVEKYKNDHLNYHGGTYARVGFELMKTMDFVMENAHNIAIKSLIIQGDSDTLTNMKGSEIIHEKFNSKNKRIHILEGGYHELLNDTNADQFLEIVVDFLKNNC